MLKRFLFLALLSSVVYAANAQVLITDTLKASFTRADLLGIGILTAQEDIDVYKIVYNTTDAQGSSTIASAAIAVPKVDSCYFPIVSYQHVTLYEKNDVPSTLNPEAVVGFSTASERYLTVMPDFLGLGESPGFHPYLHANSQATIVKDAIRAAREFAVNKGLWLNGQLFLAGYSQGGHATLATLRDMEQNHPTEFEVTAVAASSGPYDLSVRMYNLMQDTSTYPAPSFLPYLILAYQDVYGDIYDSLSQVFISPYDSLMPFLFDGVTSGTMIDAQLTAVPKDMMDSTYLYDFLNNASHPLRIRLEENDMHKWGPQTSVRLYYCEADEHVPFESSLAGRDSLLAYGAADVTALSAGATNDHETCAVGALLGSKLWFDSFKLPCEMPPVGIESVRNISKEIKVFPNPFNTTTTVTIDGSETAYSEYELIDIQGKVVRSESFEGNSFDLSREDLVHGIYTISIQNGDKQFISRVVIQ